MNEGRSGRAWTNPENWLLAMLGLFALLFFLQTWTYPAVAALFPRLVSAVVVALAFYQLAGNLRANQSARQKARADEPREQTAGKPAGLPWISTLIAIFVYFGLIYLLGFTGGTLLFLLGLPVWMGYRRWVTLAVVAVVMTLVIVVSFSSFLHIPLPEGALFKWFR